MAPLHATNDNAIACVSCVFCFPSSPKFRVAQLAWRSTPPPQHNLTISTAPALLRACSTSCRLLLSTCWVMRLAKAFSFWRHSRSMLAEMLTYAPSPPRLRFPPNVHAAFTSMPYNFRVRLRSLFITQCHHTYLPHASSGPPCSILPSAPHIVQPAWTPEALLCIIAPYHQHHYAR